MKNTRISKFKNATAPLALGLAMISAPSYAQEVSSDESDVADEGEIVVTGSRIVRPEIASVSPVTTLGAEDIQETGVTRVEDLVNNLPQAFAAQSAFISNGASGTATVNLRGLGSSRTLVLIDGRRMQAGDPAAITPDLNQIPAQLVERVDIVTGGASSVYGADAVAGVVNFVMKRDLEGVSADAQINFYQHNNSNDSLRSLHTNSAGVDPAGKSQVEGMAYDLNLAIGAGFDDGRGHVTAYAGYRQIEAVVQADYDVSNCALAVDNSNASGFRCTGSSTTPNGRFFVLGGAGGPLAVGTDLVLDETGPGNTFRARNGATDVYNYAPTNYFQRPDKRYTAGFFAEYEISDSVKPYAEFQYMDDRSVAQIAFSGTFFANEGTVNCSNPLLSGQQSTALGCTDISPTSTESASVLIGKRLVEGDPRQNDLRHTSYRAVIGVKGDITDTWSYDLYAQRGNTIYQNTYLNDLSVNRINQSLDVVAGANGPECADASNGCVPLNLFEIGGVTRQAFEFISIPGLQNADIEQYVVSGYVTGQLGSIGGASPIGVVLGAEYRKEQLQRRVDQNFAEGTLAGQGGPTAAVNGQFSVREIFGEIVVPVIEDAGVIDEFTIEGGGRMSDYSTTGTSWTYKAGATLGLGDVMKIRGVYARSVRSPNINNLFAPQTLGLFGGTDPCAVATIGGTPTGDRAGCLASGLTAAQYDGGLVVSNAAAQYNQVAGGNPNLDVEKSNSYTAGVIFSGEGLGLSGFSATIDYFNITVEETIAGVGAQNILTGCVNTQNPVFCNAVNRAPGTASLWLGSNGFVENGPLNIGGLRTDGIDVGMSFETEVGSGSVFVDYTATYLFGLETEDQPNSGFYDCVGYYGGICGSPNPEYRHRMRFGYRGENFGTTLIWRHYGGVAVDTSAPSTTAQAGFTGTLPGNVDDTISGFNWFDLSAYVNVADNIRFSAGVNNLLDKDPPLIGGQNNPSNGNTFPGVYDPIGRRIFFSASLNF